MRPRICLPLLFVALIVGACAEQETPTSFALSQSNTFGKTASSECELGVSDADALDLLAALGAEVDALAADGALNSGQARALRNHLTNAGRHLPAGRLCPARAQIEAFLEQVGNFVADGVLSEEEAQPLVDGATEILEGSAASPPPPPVDHGLPNEVLVDAPSSAWGMYGASQGSLMPLPPAEGIAGGLVLVNDGSADPTHGCEPLVGFTAGTIALVDRGTCTFVQKGLQAQAAGAVAVIVINNVDGEPPNMGGSDPDLEIPMAMVSLADGGTIRSGLPASGTLRRTP